MTTPMQANDLFQQFTGRAVEAFSLWADANQKVLRDLVDLSATTAKEGVRLYAEIQSSASRRSRRASPTCSVARASYRTPPAIPSASTRRACWSRLRAPRERSGS